MKRFLVLRGITVNSPRETFRTSALEGLINDPEIWFVFIKTRNITTHTYEEKEIDEVLTIFSIFSQKTKEFLIKIGVS